MFLPSLLFRRENGFVLVTVMMILLILTIIGIMATSTTNIELMVAGNDKVHKQTFYQADGGTELAERLVFENAVCAQIKNGFGVAPLNTLNGRIQVLNNAFADTNPANQIVSNANRGVVYYPDGIINDANPHTNFLSSFTTVPNPGTSNQMVSGYEGLGGGGPAATHRRYVISSQHFGLVNSQTLLMTQWRVDNFILASAASSDCKY